MIIENVSEFDVNIIEALEKSFIHINKDKKQVVLAKIKQRFGSRSRNSQQWFTDIENQTYDDAIRYILDDLKKTDQNFRAEILRLILKHTDGSTEYGTLLSDFFNCKENKPSLSKLRNNYAHQTEEQLQVSHSDENNLYIKSEVRKHRKNLINILSLRAVDE